jgi:hypothetical protein
MVGRMGWTIAKIWQARNATSPYLAEEEIQSVMEKFHKSRRNVEQAIKDTWARYTRKEGRGTHVVKRNPQVVKGHFRTTRHRRSTEELTPSTNDNAPPNPTIEELPLKARKRKIGLERRLFEDVRQQCLTFVEGRPLVPGQHVTIYKSRIVAVQIEKLAKGDVLPDLNKRTKGYEYVVWISSEIPDVLRSLTIMSGGSSAREAMTQALRRLEDELCART